MRLPIKSVQRKKGIRVREGIAGLSLKINIGETNKGERSPERKKNKSGMAETQKEVTERKFFN